MYVNENLVTPGGDKKGRVGSIKSKEMTGKKRTDKYTYECRLGRIMNLIKSFQEWTLIGNITPFKSYM